MNQNTEYERFTQEIYQQLVDSDVVKATTVQHNVKLIGRSGQKHQIDVYWEYEIAGIIIGEILTGSVRLDDFSNLAPFVEPVFGFVLIAVDYSSYVWC